MICPECGTENEPGRKFCGGCGERLAVVCPACEAANSPGHRFCGECGAPLRGDVPPPRPEPSTPEAERRLVSVLFADLVGFTTLAEDRDAEEVRELLSRYFDAARRVIGRYGGTVEKFIGDAVMAVWGAPIAQEDDAERAVRTALDLVGEIAVLGAEAGLPGLRLRAGVVTGEAAVTVGAEGQGMVAGDLVNTAARVQSVAEPGAVLVGESTRRLTDAAIAYVTAGEHELKGKAEPVALWRALRIIAGRGGEGRSTGLEAPFVGREAELRMVKELFHATADEGKSRVLSVMGVAGIGKSRLAWEFYKYFDGLVEDVWWHRGRCLPYGEGVAYWALAEMVRMRADIVDEELPDSAKDKLEACVSLHVRDPDERAWIEPRLAHLLGLAERTAPDQEDLFSAWRRFFELMAEEGPLILLFEDLHWADAGLLDFIEYLLEWSRTFPIFVLTLARPELLERRPTWGAGRRSFHSIVLEPLANEAREELLDGLAPGLPEEVRARIRERAEGVPLYAVETIRMLLDRGLLAHENGEFRVMGPVESLEVPETLQALIAARLDGLEAVERRLLEDAAVLGKTFTRRALTAVSGYDGAELEAALGALVRKEILTVENDPRSPERGQYGFLHALFQRVAYDTLSRKERKARHLGVASYLERTPTDDEVVEVIASHYLAAYRASPEAADAPEIRAKARERLARAAERAASLAATEEAERYFEQAAELADERLVQAELLERAGESARASGRLEVAEEHFERSMMLFADEGAAHPAARVSARLSEVVWLLGRIEEGIERMERSFEVLSGDEPDEDIAALAAQLGRLAFFTGRLELATERIEFALDIAEALGLPEVFSQALNTKSLLLYRRPRESKTLLECALRTALENDLTAAALRAYYNLTETLCELDRNEEALANARRGIELARRRGDRNWEWGLLSQMGKPLFLTGAWDEALDVASRVPDEGRVAASGFHELLVPLARIHAAQGRGDEAAALLETLAPLAGSADLDERGKFQVGRAVVLRVQGRYTDAVAAGEEAMKARELPTGAPDAVDGMIEAAEAAFALDDLVRIEAFLGWCRELPKVYRTQYVLAHEARVAARLAALRAEASVVEPAFGGAVARFRELAMPFWMAVSLTDHAEWLVDQDRIEDADPQLDEARAVFERLKAVSWLERLEVIQSQARAAMG